MAGVWALGVHSSSRTSSYSKSNSLPALWGFDACSSSTRRRLRVVQPRQPTSPKGAYVARSVRVCSPFVRFLFVYAYHLGRFNALKEFLSQICGSLCHHPLCRHHRMQTVCTHKTSGIKVFPNLLVEWSVNSGYAYNWNRRYPSTSQRVGYVACAAFWRLVFFGFGHFLFSFHLYEALCNNPLLDVTSIRHANRHPFGIKITHFQAHYFADVQTGSIRRHQQRLVSQIVGHLQEFCYLTIILTRAVSHSPRRTDNPQLCAHFANRPRVPLAVRCPSPYVRCQCTRVQCSSGACAHNRPMS
jgi:hypothetical protein